MKNPKNVLVCEDDPVQLKILTTLIDQAGHRALAARTPREAMVAARRCCVDAVLTDVQLQDGNAFDLLNDLRAIGSDAPVFMTSAFASDGMKARAHIAGVVRFFDKPFDLLQIRKQVDEALNGVSKLEAGVLIVEGHPQVRADLEQTALSAGFDVCSARDGAGAIEILGTRKPAVDLVLIDIHADGPNSAAFIGKALEINPSLYVVMMSGDATRDEIGAGYAAGATSLILKPIPAERLQIFLKANLKAARMAQVRAALLRERREQQAAQPILRRLLRWVKSCLHAPPHSRRGRSLGIMTLTGIALTVGAGMTFVLQTLNEKADHYEAMMNHVMQMTAPLQGPVASNRDAMLGNVRVTEQLQLMREANDVTRRYYEDHLQEMRWQSRSQPAPEMVQH